MYDHVFYKIMGRVDSIGNTDMVYVRRDCNVGSKYNIFIVIKKFNARINEKYLIF